MLVNSRPARFSFHFLKGHHHKRENETIFIGLKIYEMTLPDQIVFLAFSRLRKMTYQNFISSGIGKSAVTFAS
jgi:hypothetical protein